MSGWNAASLRTIRSGASGFLKAAREAARNNVELEAWLNVVFPKLGPREHIHGCRTAEQFMELLKVEYQHECDRYTEERSNEDREEKLEELLEDQTV